MKLLCGLVISLLIGCNTVSDVAMKEVNDAAEIGNRIYNAWDVGVRQRDGTYRPLTDEEKKGFVYRFTRALYNVRADVLEEPIPEQYRVQFEVERVEPPR